MAMDGNDTELVPTEAAFPVEGLSIVRNHPPGANVTSRRVNRAGRCGRRGTCQAPICSADHFDQHDNRLLNNSETAHRSSSRVEEVEAIMNSHYGNEMRRLETEAARTTCRQK